MFIYLQIQFKWREPCLLFWIMTEQCTLTISPLNVCFQTLDSSSSDNFDEKIVNNCISNLFIPAKLETSILQLSQTKFISSLVQENISGVLTHSKISLRSLGVKWLMLKIDIKLASFVNFEAYIYYWKCKLVASHY